MRRFGVLLAGLALAASMAWPAVAANPLAAYRCAGAGTLTGTLMGGPYGPGWVWHLTATGACALSPQGPWTFTVDGYGYNGTCGQVPPETADTMTPYSPLVMRFHMTNPRTHALRDVTNAWYLSATPQASVVEVHGTYGVPSCSSPIITGKVGTGVLVHTPDDQGVIEPASMVVHQVAFVAQFR